MDKVILDIIILLHIAFVLFIVITPFVGSNYFLVMHVITVPFMLLHWYLNDNTCCLTLIESQLRYKIYGKMPSQEDCISYKLIAPVYDFKKNNTDIDTFLYSVSILLWVGSICKLWKKHKDGKFSSLRDIALY
jgi:hypothetical protein